MVISKLNKTQLVKNHNELVEQLQKQARVLFYDSMMYEINDSLTSILAACDVEGKEAIPKIKQYIHRINQSLSNSKNYQSDLSGEKKFNISLVLKNLINVVEEKYKTTKLTCLISDIKAPVQGGQSNFEALFLHIFVGLFSEGIVSDSAILIELRQKDQNAMITILKDYHIFSSEMLEVISNFKEDEDFKGNVRITPHGNGVEVIIKIPLQFQVINVSKPIPKMFIVNAATTAVKSSAQNQPVKPRRAVTDSWESSNNEGIFPRFAY